MKHILFDLKDCPSELLDNEEHIRMSLYVADIDYNSMILYPSHYWHNSYIKEDWFIDEDRITLTGFFETLSEDEE